MDKKMRDEARRFFGYEKIRENYDGTIDSLGRDVRGKAIWLFQYHSEQEMIFDMQKKGWAKK